MLIPVPLTTWSARSEMDTSGVDEPHRRARRGADQEAPGPSEPVRSEP